MAAAAQKKAAAPAKATVKEKAAEPVAPAKSATKNSKAKKTAEVKDSPEFDKAYDSFMSLLSSIKTGKSKISLQRLKKLLNMIHNDMTGKN